MVEELSLEHFDISLLCKTLNVSTNGYYKWLKRPPSKRRMRDEVLCELISKIHVDSRETYGAKRIQEKLKSDGEVCGKKKVSKLMKRQGIQGIAKKKFKVHTTASNHDHPVADRIFKVEEVEKQVTAPNQVWASDITYSTPSRSGPAGCRKERMSMNGMRMPTKGVYKLSTALCYEGA
jgi:putative transposase